MAITRSNIPQDPSPGIYPFPNTSCDGSSYFASRQCMSGDQELEVVPHSFWYVIGQQIRKLCERVDAYFHHCLTLPGAAGATSDSCKVEDRDYNKNAIVRVDEEAVRQLKEKHPEVMINQEKISNLSQSIQRQVPERFEKFLHEQNLWQKQALTSQLLNTLWKQLADEFQLEPFQFFSLPQAYYLFPSSHAGLELHTKGSHGNLEPYSFPQTLAQGNGIPPITYFLQLWKQDEQLVRALLEGDPSTPFPLTYEHLVCLYKNPQGQSIIERLSNINSSISAIRQMHSDDQLRPLQEKSNQLIQKLSQLHEQHCTSHPHYRFEKSLKGLSWKIIDMRSLQTVFLLQQCENRVACGSTLNPSSFQEKDMTQVAIVAGTLAMGFIVGALAYRRKRYPTSSDPSIRTQTQQVPTLEHVKKEKKVRFDAGLSSPSTSRKGRQVSKSHSATTLQPLRQRSLSPHRTLNYQKSGVVFPEVWLQVPDPSDINATNPTLVVKEKPITPAKEASHLNRHSSSSTESETSENE